MFYVSDDIAVGYALRTQAETPTWWVMKEAAKNIYKKRIKRTNEQTKLNKNGKNETKNRWDIFCKSLLVMAVISSHLYRKRFIFFAICHKPCCLSSPTMEVRRHATVPNFGHLGGSKVCELFSTLLRPSSAKHVQPVKIPPAKRKNIKNVFCDPQRHDKAASHSHFL